MILGTVRDTHTFENARKENQPSQSHENAVTVPSIRNIFSFSSCWVITIKKNIKKVNIYPEWFNPREAHKEMFKGVDKTPFNPSIKIPGCLKSDRKRVADKWSQNPRKLYTRFYVCKRKEKNMNLI